MLRALIELRTGDPADALRLLRPIVPDALAAGPATAIELLMLFGEASYHAGDAQAWHQATAAVERLPLDDPADTDVALLRLARAVGRVRAGTPAGLAENDLAIIERLADPGRLCWAGGMVWGIGDRARSRWLRRRAMERAVALGASGTLAWVLQFVVIDELAAGRLLAAAAHADEGHRHAVETGQPNLGAWFLGTLATVAALRGRNAEAREFADQALTGTVGRNLVAAVALANRALGLLDLAAGRAEQAVAYLRPLVGPAHPGLVLGTVPDFVEAAHRLDRPDLVAEPLARYTRWAEATGSPDLLALAARCAALGGAGEAAFRRALELHPADQPVELARTQLLYGEYLRRDRRRADARTQLRAALAAFTHLDATGWADRARDELRATGETTTEPTPDAVSVALSALTPQELRIATAGGRGVHEPRDRRAAVPQHPNGRPPPAEGVPEDGHHVAHGAGPPDRAPLRSGEPVVGRAPRRPGHAAARPPPGRRTGSGPARGTGCRPASRHPRTGTRTSPGSRESRPLWRW